MGSTRLHILPVYSEECLNPDYQIGEVRLLKHQVETLAMENTTVLEPKAVRLIEMKQALRKQKLVCIISDRRMMLYT